ncbi:type I-E CRISPR-associated protein Cse2/CasB [Actinomadura mexicana]|uniref:CRISPR system Cascade subunit CasB n=1 Tax=Actinomadura mexicana TaxID=134959 RepID=A0A239GV09_9ACTN|nr:type I-E CRISPR-associated protein Cse2/CasB [Actinomadura mexicana]SNS72343.1 CRISPR system Cascade subunit CasB [Actinomadura mexicana]
MTTQTAPSENSTIRRAREFVADVVRLCDDPGKRAALRSGLGRPLDRCHRMHQVLAARVPTGSDSRERAYYAVAAMIASLPPQARGTASPSAADQSTDDLGAVRRRNFGQCLAEGVGRGALRETAAEARLNLLTRQSIDGVHRHLPAAVRAVADHPSAVDWAQLLADLHWWEHYRDQITRRWLQSFYRTRFQAERDAAEQADRAERPKGDPA